MQIPHPDVVHSVREWARPDRDLPKWRDRPCWQFPADLWRYAELCWEFRPPFVLEVGTSAGGTALFLADVLASIGYGEVITVDIRRSDVHHPQLSVLTGDAASGEVFEAVKRLADDQRGIVLLDGDHTQMQVAKELNLYADLANYLVVQDTIMRWLPDYGYGPHQALEHWLPTHPEFKVDHDPVPGPTQHPGGWLRRVAD